MITDKRQKAFLLKLSKEMGISVDVLNAVCFSPFQFASMSIRNNDKRTMMFPYFGKIKMKNKYLDEKENKDKH